MRAVALILQVTFLMGGVVLLVLAGSQPHTVYVQDRTGDLKVPDVVSAGVAAGYGVAAGLCFLSAAILHRSGADAGRPRAAGGRPPDHVAESFAQMSRGGP